MRYTRIKAGWLPLVWNGLVQEEIKVGVFDMPMLPFPIYSSPEAVSYYHWHSQEDDGFAYKQNDTALGQKIVGIFGASPLKHDIPTNKTAIQIDRISKFCQDAAVTRGRISKWLMENSAWDLFIICFSELHRAGHYLRSIQHSR